MYSEAFAPRKKETLLKQKKKFMNLTALVCGITRMEETSKNLL